MDAAVKRTIAHLQSEAAKVPIAGRGCSERTAGSGRVRREPRRPQAADRVSVAPRVAARDRARPQRAGGVRVRRAESRRLDSRQRQRRGRQPLRAALHRDHAAGSGADLRDRHGRRRRRRDHGPADGGALREGQPAAAATDSTSARRTRTSPSTATRSATRIFPAAATASATRLRSATRRGRFRWTPSCGFSRSRIDGR